MALIIKEIKLEVSKPNLIQAIVAKQNDCNSRFLKASLWDEGVQIPIHSSSAVTINAERNDGKADSFFGEVNEDNTATVPLHSWMLELEGEVKCDVSILDTEGRKLTTTTFVVKVEKAANGSEHISTDPEYDVLVNLIEEVENLKENNTLTGVANAIKDKVSGEAVRLDCVSPLEHEIGVKLSGGTELAKIWDQENSLGQETNGNEVSGFYTVTSINIYYDEPGSQVNTDGGGNYFVKDDFYGYAEKIKVGDTVYVDVESRIVYLQQEKTDFSDVTVTKYGKNLLNRNATVCTCGTLDFDGERQTFYRDNESDGSRRGDLNTVIGNYQDFVGKTITISFYFADCKAGGSSFSTLLTTKSGGSAIVLADGKSASFSPKYVEGGVKAKATYTIPENDTAEKLILRQYVGYITTGIGDYITMDNLQVEIGNTVTEWEEGKEPKDYAINEDGTPKEPITSLSPTTTLMTDTEGVNIEVEYNIDTKKYIDKKFAELAATILNS